MMATLQSTTPLVPGGPEWLTMPVALIAGGVLIALLILMIGARMAGRRRRAAREEREYLAAHARETEDIPTARPITPRPPDFATAPAFVPEVFPDPEPVYAEAPEPVADHVEGAPAREPEPEPLAEAPNPEAEPVDAAPDGLTAATEEPPVAAEGEPVFEAAPEPTPEPVLADEPIAAAAPMEATPATLAADLAEPEPVAPEPVVEAAAEPEPVAEHVAVEEAPELAAAEPVVEPVAEAAPEPVVEATSDFASAPAFVPEIFPTPEPVAVPAPEPVAEVEAAAAPAPTVPDDLTRMKGVGPRLADRLNAVGVTNFAQIAALSPEDAVALDAKLGDFQGRLERDRWIEQAAYLSSGDIAGFEETFGKL